MKAIPLKPAELDMISTIFRRHPAVTLATLFGSRANGTHTERSDVDLALTGQIDPLGAERIAGELDELPLPYQFDVKALNHIHYPPLLEHINRVGIVIYRGVDMS